MAARTVLPVKHREVAHLFGFEFYVGFGWFARWPATHAEQEGSKAKGDCHRRTESARLGRSNVRESSAFEFNRDPHHQAAVGHTVRAWLSSVAEPETGALRWYSDSPVHCCAPSSSFSSATPGA